MTTNPSDDEKTNNEVLEMNPTKSKHRQFSIVLEGPILPEKDFTPDKFFERVQISGLADMYSATSCFVKSFWFCIIIASSTALLCNMAESIKEYYYSPIKTSISFTINRSMELPEIYICPSNYVAFKRESCRIDPMLWDVQRYVELLNPFPTGLAADDTWMRYMSKINAWASGTAKRPQSFIGTGTYPILPRPKFECPGSNYGTNNMTISQLKESLMEVSMEPSELITRIKFLGEWLDLDGSSKYVTRILDKEHGMCYRLKIQKRQNVEGIGLDLTLDLHMDEVKTQLKTPNEDVAYLRTFSKYSGALIRIGNPVDLIGEGGFFVGVGQFVNVDINLNLQQLVNIDYSATPQICLHKADYPSFAMLQGQYTVQKCNIDCFLPKVLERCNCLPILDASELKPQYYNAPACTKITLGTCVMGLALLANDIVGCSAKCNLPCNFQKYGTEISSMPAHTIGSDNDRAKWTIDLRIAYGDLGYTTIVQSQATSLAQLLSDIGGQSGLYIGASFFTFIQLVALLSAWCYTASSKVKK